MYYKDITAKSVCDVDTLWCVSQSVLRANTFYFTDAVTESVSAADTVSESDYCTDAMD